MPPNKLKQLWQAGDAVVNGWLQIPSSWSAEIMAHAGYDSLTIDFQHGFTNMETALTMFQTISTTTVVPMARIPWNDPAWAQRLLDAGAYGLICPMVNTRAECEQFVGACRYHPDGYRSKGPTRPRLLFGNDYVGVANHEIITMAMIETATALENADEICSVKGLDAIYVGPGDLSLSLGGSQGMDYTEPMLVEALDTIYAACRRNGVVAGLHCGSAEYARQMISKGWQFVTVSTDGGLLQQIARKTVNTVRGNKNADSIASIY